MKITPDRLAVARAVQAEYLRSWVEPSHRSAAATLALDILIESLPEPPDDSPATLPTVDPLQSFDASVWAREFRRIAISLGYSDMDEGWLIGWFANSIMRGFDEHARRQEQPEPLPAPTGPDMCAHNAAHTGHTKTEWSWARERKTQVWHMARVAFPRPSPKGDDVLIASPISGFSNTLRNRSDFDAWLPLVAPTAKGGAE